MMAGNPNWWTMHPQPHHFIYGAASPPPSDQTPDFPVKSWSQLLLGGLGGGEEEEDERYGGGGGGGVFQHQKKVESNWEEQQQVYPNFLKQELSQSTQIYDDHDQFQPWPRQHHAIPVSSPTSCVTTLSNSVLNFSGSRSAASTASAAVQRKNSINQDHSSECNSGGATKKARVQQSTAQPALKVRKEKLGDRITALHQLVSPFGKTDTASVLSEAIGYIRFLQGQIEALSSPYMRNGAGNTAHHQQHSVQERNCLFPEEPSQFLNDITMEGRGAPKQESQGRLGVGDLRSRGLCLVPISCTQHVGNDNGADYWAPAATAFGGGF